MAGEGISSGSATWRIKDRLVDVRFPLVMGILNATPDSFHAASRVTVDNALRIVERMLADGAAILDIGGASSRPGAAETEKDDELARVLPVIAAIHQRFPEALVSIDTYHARVAKEAVTAGASMVNDIGAGLLDEAMLPTVATLGVPYVAMHMQGTPAMMQDEPKYGDVAAEVTLFLSERLRAAHAAGIADVLIDPGFGFGKTVDHNYALLASLQRLTHLGAPVLVGLSRKRMINAVLGTSPEKALNGTTALNTIALMQGASLLRVHDVCEAVECVKLYHAVRGDQK
ncbi:MAG: dihydropteroate synthase [Flavobacteriales bacterium]|nr:dihydropteroate synthase [Flavobacteriales bacterium]MCC6938598.1 dihydropteroate synthase [Flavobacteriales bacterium]